LESAFLRNEWDGFPSVWFGFCQPHLSRGALPRSSIPFDAGECNQSAQLRNAADSRTSLSILESRFREPLIANVRGFP
jgi:hypothetical protein